ncbi:MAG: acetyl-CoA carboxylase carboxyltransferase subunit beta [Candidatus Dadabacteria bacterium]|nr:MAG: acetyl-CoA carboxylase carboxyltransferase subunit beta [Candidatus Dadabacteria bacterium]
MAWFLRRKAPKPTSQEGSSLQIPEDIWSKCPKCNVILYTKDLKRNLGVCTKCQYHFRLSLAERIQVLCDSGSFVELWENLRSADPLNFRDSKRYKDRLKKAEKTSGSSEGIVVGTARVKGIAVALAVFNFSFMGGSMGVVVGEKFARIAELALSQKKPLIASCASGGARMQEGVFSLMQMAKVSAALARLAREHIPYISVLTDPTTGGVAASLAMQGDIIIAEPKALIGFAGPRVIEQTIKQKLPEGFQRSEFLLEHGMIDLISPRAELINTLAVLLSNLGYKPE